MTMICVLTSGWFAEKFPHTDCVFCWWLRKFVELRGGRTRRFGHMQWHSLFTSCVYEHEFHFEFQFSHFHTQLPPKYPFNLDFLISCLLEKPSSVNTKFEYMNVGTQNWCKFCFFTHSQFHMSEWIWLQNILSSPSPSLLPNSTSLFCCSRVKIFTKNNDIMFLVCRMSSGSCTCSFPVTYFGHFQSHEISNFPKISHQTRNRTFLPPICDCCSHSKYLIVNPMKWLLGEKLLTFSANKLWRRKKIQTFFSLLRNRWKQSQRHNFTIFPWLTRSSSQSLMSFIFSDLSFVLLSIWKMKGEQRGKAGKF